MNRDSPQRRPDLPHTDQGDATNVNCKHVVMADRSIWALTENGGPVQNQIRTNIRDMSCVTLPQHKHTYALSHVVELSQCCGVFTCREVGLDCLSCDIAVVFVSVEVLSVGTVLPAHCSKVHHELAGSSSVKRTRRFPLLPHPVWLVLCVGGTVHVLSISCWNM